MRTILTCLGSILFLGLTACSGDDDNSPPKLDTIPSQTASVGTQLAVALRATDPDGDPVTFSFKSDISDLGTRAWIDSGAGGTAVFKWIPIGADVGVHAFDFIASDGTDKARQTVEIDVKSAAAGEGSPVFIKPLGTGTTLDLTTKDEVVVPIVIGDADSTQVTLEQEPPLIDGATLDQTDGLVGTWTWKPTPEQILDLKVLDVNQTWVCSLIHIIIIIASNYKLINSINPTIRFDQPLITIIIIPEPIQNLLQHLLILIYIIEKSSFLHTLLNLIFP